MNHRLFVKLAGRINVLLQHELSHAIEPARMLADGLYARDVLLVCDAFDGHELSRLSARWREELATAAQQRPAAAAPDSGGFSASRFLNSLSSFFGIDVPPPARARRTGPRARVARTREAAK